MNAPAFIFKRDDYLSRTQREGTEVRLLAKAENVEVHRQHIAAKRTFWLDSAEEWQGFEFIYVLSGQLAHLDVKPPVVLGPGDYIARHLVPERAYFEARTDATVLYVSSQPAFQRVSQETKEFVELARQIEKDEYTDGHCARISHLSRLLGEWMDLPGERLFNLGYAAFFHDLGKAKVPKAILQKPGALDEDEWTIMKQHTVWGRQMLEGKDFLRQAGRIVEQTHERVDGGGYPHGLVGDRITLEAKIIAAVDAFDAMTTDRPYRRALARAEAVRRLQGNAGTQFDAKVVQAFVAMLRQQDFQPHFDPEPVPVRRREAFLKLGEEILNDRDIQQILEQVVGGIVEYTPYRRAALALYDRAIPPDSAEAVEIVRVACFGLSEEEEARLKSNPLPPAERRKIFAQRFELGRSYYIPHDQLPWGDHDGLIPGHPDAEPDDTWHPDDFLCIPMWAQNQIVGIISVDQPVDGRRPSAETLEPIEVFANFAALALERARHLDKLDRFQERLRGIYALSERLSHVTSVKRLIDEAMSIITQHFSFDHASLFFVADGELVLQDFRSRLPREEFDIDRFRRIRIGEGVTGWAARHRAPLLVPDTANDPRYIAGHAAVCSELAVPVEDRGELLGVLNIESVRPRTFGPEETELLTALARQTGAALSNLWGRQRLSEALREREWTNAFLQALNQVRELDALLELVIRRGIDLLAPRADAGSALIWDEDEGAFAFRAAVNRDLEALKHSPIPAGDVVQAVHAAEGPVLLSRKDQLIRSTLRDFSERTGTPPPASTIVVPIREEGRLVALLNLNNLEREDALTQRDAEALWALVPEIELALSRTRDRERLKAQAVRDPLTGAYNRHYLNELVEREGARAKRYGHTLALILVDFVDFYRVNDRLGHVAGDRVLRRAAQHFQRAVRACDAVIRYGGDEFLIVLPETDRAEALRVCKRLEDEIERLDWGVDARPRIRAGLAVWEPESERPFEAVLEEADTWMYRHKRRAKRGASGTSRA